MDAHAAAGTDKIKDNITALMDVIPPKAHSLYITHFMRSEGLLPTFRKVCTSAIPGVDQALREVLVMNGTASQDMPFEELSTAIQEMFLVGGCSPAVLCAVRYKGIK